MIAAFEDCQASPHPRGWTRDPASLARLEEGFPAPAGMDPLPAYWASGLIRLPRTRGDGPGLTHWPK